MEIIVFDGVCNLCNGAVNFIIDHDPKNRFRFVALQSETGQELLNRYPSANGPVDSIVLIRNGQSFVKSDAALAIARCLSGVWPVLTIFRIIPRFLRDAVYDLIARNRYRFFGKQDACRLPTPELRARFLE
ncbi:thiol-disulfide oxidoreductase DCC family protein [Larkinella rosea]|uniref:Thiol-disulfide oxidoreductase DCC family protein n=1 Tax=Larkinella rosea TaxID=2025312 RepID=A0A3P1BUK5_9BACT|nr:thiol-disulfide oxidoreductase DCC family protein [Larkinella rosea]RRB04589.1 thiol-disulfide oxidoreductase DCC family protein [Larkinella rosea]